MSPPTDPGRQSAGPLVTMVVPSYNHAQYLPAALDSLLAQDYQPLEVIVVDGGSTDGTLDILRGYDGRLKWVSEPDHGMYEAVNKGWRMGHGEYVGFLNSDDLLCPGALLELAGHLTRHPATGLVYGDYYRIDEAGAVLERFSASPQTTDSLLQNGNSIFTGAMLLRRELLATIGWLDETLKCSADYDFVIRASRQHRLDHLPLPLAKFRMHTHSKSQNSQQEMWREALAISAKYSGRRQWGLITRYWFDTFIRRAIPGRLLWSARLVPMRKLLRRLWQLGQ
ncbi:MAG: glycosyltransferase family 2 protein [Anaerolineales bacterium]